MAKTKIIDAKHIVHSYVFGSSEQRSLDNISLKVKQGEFVAFLGENGGGKTTLARHLNALLPVQSGELTIAELDAKDEKNTWTIRQKCGMVFQNPDNQFTSSVVGEDIAFGLKNFGVPEKEIPNRVSEALQAVGLANFEQRSVQLLSGGEKQRMAIAGVLAVKPDIMIFDEVTSMLDPDGRRDVLEIIRRLHADGRTIILITQETEDAVFADTVIFFHKGKVIAKGRPKVLLTDLKLLKEAGLNPPLSVCLYYDLKKSGIELPSCPITIEELVENVCQFR